ncbi:DsbE family thiol:disulfide interchange protein [Marinibacterium profundimaris]|uniref:Thiol:disulfide interchange protein n=1 Tax=Marinibacterium profundimaris TaxID=1679460 RepID=A0A225NQL1_9RHOB|nr:DsbE family thiol:disulfide interchange protein [Marinibacterium profundimaris]OWU77251.1 thiol:disulfide interchange protein [Marinibacterium profundimaris]
MAKISPLMIAPPAIFAALVVTFGIGMFREDPDALPSAREGAGAPPVVLTQLGDKPSFTDADLRDGEVKLVNFWASWCAPCRVEHPNLEALKDEGLTIYGVNYKDEPANALGFLAELGDPYTAIGADNSGRMGLDWGLYGVPETYVIDGEGEVILRFAGPLTERAIADKLRPALARAAAE